MNYKDILYQAEAPFFGLSYAVSAILVNQPINSHLYSSSCPKAGAEIAAKCAIQGKKPLRNPAA